MFAVVASLTLTIPSFAATCIISHPNAGRTDRSNPVTAGSTPGVDQILTYHPNGGSAAQILEQQQQLGELQFPTSLFNM